MAIGGSTNEGRLQPESTGYRNKLNLVYTLKASGIITALASICAMYGARSAWIGHAVTGGVGIALLIMVISTGAGHLGRIHPRFPNIFRLHRTASISSAILLVGAFILGILLMLRHRFANREVRAIRDGTKEDHKSEVRLSTIHEIYSTTYSAVS